MSSIINIFFIINSYMHKCTTQRTSAADRSREGMHIGNHAQCSHWRDVQPGGRSASLIQQRLSPQQHAEGLSQLAGNILGMHVSRCSG